MQLKELAPHSPAGPPVSNDTLVDDLDIFILVVILAFTLLNIPRALVYLVNNRSKVSQGYLLRSAVASKTNHSGSPTTEKFKEKVLPESFSTHGSAVTLNKQWHLPMYLSLRHPAAGFMHHHVLGNYTIIQVILMAGYTDAVLFAAFYGSNPLHSPARTGLVVTSQFPFVYAFATKNTAIGLLVGIGYEKLNYLHRHVGRLMVIGANVHAIGHIYKWTLTGAISENVAIPFIYWGIIALVCFDLLGFFSIHFVRTKSYNLFFGTHVVGLIMALFAACYHQQPCVPYVIAATVVYGLDHIVRAIKTRFTTAALRTIPELGLTRIDIPSLKMGWRAGQHVRLRIISTAMGFGGMSEVHPFTISSATNVEEGLVLMCKRTGKWTNKLYEIAQTTAPSEQDREPVTRIKVMIEGPYGGIGDTTLPNYSGAMFVAGGSGVTFALSAVQDLVLAGDRSRTKVVDVVWSISDPAALEHFIPLFAPILSPSGTAAVRISVFYTRATKHSFEGYILPPGITLSPGRPNITKLLDGFATSVMRKGGAHGVFIGVCGPVGLGEDVARAVWAFDVESKKALGGIQFHDEVFAW